MSLFNSFNNKTLLYIINYCNQVNRNCEPLSETELSSQLLGEGEKLTSPELVDMILNRCKDPKDNLNLLKKDSNGKMIPIFSEDYFENVYSPITNDERSWLKYILNDTKSDLFFNNSVIKTNLLKELNSFDSPLDAKYIDIRRTNTATGFTPEYISIFNTLITHIENKCCSVINVKDSENGMIVENTVLPYRLIYNFEFDSFSLLCYNSSTNDIMFIELADICDINKSESVHEKSDYESFFKNELKKHLVATPIKVEIALKKKNDYLACMADDRFCHLFASYETLNYFDESDHLISEITYYDFQYNDVIQKLLSLGKYVTVLSPEEVLNDIINIIL